LSLFFVFLPNSFGFFLFRSLSSSPSLFLCSSHFLSSTLVPHHFFLSLFLFLGPSLFPLFVYLLSPSPSLSLSSSSALPSFQTRCAEFRACFPGPAYSLPPPPPPPPFPPPPSPPPPPPCPLESHPLFHALFDFNKKNKLITIPSSPPSFPPSLLLLLRIARLHLIFICDLRPSKT